MPRKSKDTINNKNKDIISAKKAELKAKLEALKEKSKKRNNKKGVLSNTVIDNRLELLITIVSRSKGEYYSDLLHSFDVNMQFVTLGYGTANADMMSKFGLTDTDKTVIFSVIQGNKIKDALDTLENKFRTIKNGKGIAYTIPLSSVMGKLIFGFLSNNRMAADNTSGE